MRFSCYLRQSSLFLFCTFSTNFPSVSLTTDVETDDRIQAYSGVYIERQTNGQRGWQRTTERSSEKGKFSKSLSNKWGIDRTRSWRVINEQDSQDFTAAEVVFVKRFHYHHRRQRRMVEIRALLAPRRVGRRSMSLRRRSSDLPLPLYRRSAR